MIIISSSSIGCIGHRFFLSGVSSIRPLPAPSMNGPPTPGFPANKIDIL